MESKGRHEKYSEYERNIFSYKPQTWICAPKETSAFTLVCAIHSFSFHSFLPMFSRPFFLLSYLSVFMRRFPIYSPVYLYFSSPLQASSLLRLSSIFQIKWSWLKDRANVWFFKRSRVSPGTPGAILDLHYFFMLFDYGHS